MAESPYLDKRSIMQVLGSLKNNPNLFTRTDKYNLIEEDFDSDFYILIFGTLQNLKAQGLQRIDLLDIDNYLATRPGARKLYEDNDGADYVAEISKVADTSKFDYYYQRLKKMTLLRMYDKYGVDVTWLYNPNTLNVREKQRQEDWLDSVDRRAIVAEVDNRFDEISSKFSYEGSDDVQAGENIFELIEELKKAPDVGPPLFGPLINTVTKGARLKKFYLRSAPTGVGKSQPNNLIIPTPQGFRAIGEIEPGDFLFDRKGKPTKVLQIHPQKSKRHVYEVTFADGRKSECCGDHLWEYFTDRRYPHKVKTTKEMMEIANENRGYSGSSGYLFKVPINGAVEFPEREYNIEPYTIGALLGDGSFRQPCLTFSSSDEETVKKIAKLEDWNYFKENNNTFTWFFREKWETRNRIQSKDSLSGTKLNHLKSEEKFIPEEYLFGSIDQRMSLLQGLLDTDGSIDKKGRVTYHTISEKMKDDVLSLVRGLGFIGTVLEDRREDKYPVTGVCYRISIQSNVKFKKKMFSLKRKVDRAIQHEKTSKRKEHNDYNAIIKIEKLDRLEEMTCFTVDNEEHLFLTNDYIVTHNTRMMIADACNIACDEIYDIYEQKWVSNGVSQPTVYITTEQEIDEIQTMMLAFLSGVDEENIITGDYAEGEEERVVYGAKLLQKSDLWIEEMPDFSLNDIENRIRSHVLDNEVQMVFFDYIHTSLKIMEEITRRTGGIRLREDQILYMLAIRLKDIANEMGVFIMSSTQLNGKQLP